MLTLARSRTWLAEWCYTVAQWIGGSGWQPVKVQTQLAMLRAATELARAAVEHARQAKHQSAPGASSSVSDDQWRDFLCRLQLRKQ